MMTRPHMRFMRAILTALATTAAAPAFAATLNGQAQGGGVPIANSTVTLWSASAGSPKQLAQAKTGADGRFALNAPDAADKGGTLYLVAKGGISAANKAGGDNPAIVLMTALGSKPPATVTINEMTTVASVWTHNQFINGTVIQGQPLQLKIAAGNVPNFVDLASGGWGKAIQDALNSTQSPTMANFATLANVLAGCVTSVKPNACQSLFAASTAPDGKVPGDTLAAATSIARAPWHQPQKVFALLDEFYPVSAGKKMPRATPFAPYLIFAPSSWVLPLRFTGGGYYAGGKLMFDSQGNVWAASNFQVGAQAQDYF